MLFTEVIEIKYAGGPSGALDDFGNPIMEPPTSMLWPAWHQPRESSEALEAREQQVWGKWVYLPRAQNDLESALQATGLATPLTAAAEASNRVVRPLTAADAVVIDAVTYEVDGEPGATPSGFIVPGYVKAAVERVTG